MRKELYSKIEIPHGVEVSINDSLVKFKGPEGELKKKFNLGKLELEKKDGHILIGNKKSTKVEKKMKNTIVAHIKNMIKGVQEGFEYRLKICFIHFPITVEMKEKDLLIKNFLGEKIPRVVKFPEGVDVKINKDVITINSLDIELAGQAAANIETATKISSRDRRVFQDGIFITHKHGDEI